LPLAECPPRAVSALGTCFAFEWTPEKLPSVFVQWIYNSNWEVDSIWDSLCVAPGATKLKFLARGERGGELATFGVLTDIELSDVSLTDSWQEYSIDLPSDYNHHVDADGVAEDPGVRVGFLLKLTHPELGRQRVFVDDIRWEGEQTQCRPPGDLPSACEAPPPPPAGQAPQAATAWCDPAPIGAELPADPTADLLLVDDLEDGDERSLPLPGGRGRWSIRAATPDQTPFSIQYPDASCVRPSLPPLGGGAADPSHFAMRTTGCGFRLDAGLRLTLRDKPPDCDAPFDADAYDGVSFRLYQAQATLVAFQVHTPRALPAADPEWACPGKCNSFQVMLPSAPGWTDVKVPFSDLNAESGSGLLDPGAIISMDWIARSSPTQDVAGSASFDIAVDDVAFYRLPAKTPSTPPGK
jgi:hypothetical protein